MSGREDPHSHASDGRGIADDVRSESGDYMKTALAALLISIAAPSLSSAQTTPVLSSCKPTIVPAEYHRGVPGTYVDQGLASIPHLYPKHVLLAARRADQLGPITFSLLVYKEDSAQSEVAIEGMALEGPPDDLKAWTFTARCRADNLADGLVTTLEEIAKLGRH